MYGLRSGVVAALRVRESMSREAHGFIGLQSSAFVHKRA